MLVVYDSLTGNVERFVNRLGMNICKIIPDLIINEPFALVTYTIGFGNVPKSTIEFLERNYAYLRAVASSGNKNWGVNYAKAADVITNKYNVPVLLKFELSGTANDEKLFIERLRHIEGFGTQ
jgi:protein involved in ribonucleotide reduction